MNTCKTCKWWKKTLHDSSNVMTCWNPKCGEADDEKESDGFYSNADFAMRFGPDFGCIHHSEV